LGGLLLAVGIGMLWSAAVKFHDPRPSPLCTVSPCGWPVALIAKELLFRFMLAVAQRVRSSMLVANAWHARRMPHLRWWSLSASSVT
jgi:divalent metal cation (Fe/Co/Zn/Cd) transporter